jgi:hypothetical protein
MTLLFDGKKPNLLYYCTFLLIPAKPIRPRPRNSIVESLEMRVNRKAIWAPLYDPIPTICPLLLMSKAASFADYGRKKV